MNAAVHFGLRIFCEFVCNSECLYLWVMGQERRRTSVLLVVVDLYATDACKLEGESLILPVPNT